MEINVNNQIKEFPSGELTVQALLDLEIPDRQNGIALAINNTVIPKSDWHTHFIRDQDDILIIIATQGG